MSKHTPGPWNSYGDGLKPGATPFWVSGDYNPLDDTSQEVASGIHNEADARLIAAAPEMLAQLKLAELIIAKIDPHAPDLVSIRYAIKKAEGEK